MSFGVLSGGDMVIGAAFIAIGAALAYGGGSWAQRRSDQAAEAGRHGHALAFFFLFLLLGVPLAWFLLSLQGAATAPPVPTPYVPTPMP